MVDAKTNKAQIANILANIFFNHFNMLKYTILIVAPNQ